jgi:hypothetical protein
MKEMAKHVPSSAAVVARALLILAEWPEFAALDLFPIRAVMNLPIVLDGKNLLDPDKVRAAGLQYHGVGCCPDAGRPTMRTEEPVWMATISGRESRVLTPEWCWSLR